MCGPCVCACAALACRMQPCVWACCRRWRCGWRRTRGRWRRSWCSATPWCSWCRCTQTQHRCVRVCVLACVFLRVRLHAHTWRVSRWPEAAGCRYRGTGETGANEVGGPGNMHKHSNACPCNRHSLSWCAVRVQCVHNWANACRPNACDLHRSCFAPDASWHCPCPQTGTSRL